MPSKGDRVYWGLRTFCLITGASRGIGQEIAHQFAKKFKPGSLTILMARSESGLEKTKSMIHSSAPEVHVKVVPTDLSEPNNDVYRNVITSALQEHKVKASDFEHAMIVNNAVALLDDNTKMVAPTTTVDDIDAIQKYMKMNVTATMVLTAQFLKIFTEDAVKKRSVLQTSSIASVMPIPTNALYCMTKNARNMYFRTLAVEESSLDVFSFGPGPVDTDLLRQIEIDSGKGKVDELIAKGIVITCEQSVNWLVKLLAEGNYTSGDFKDVFEIPHYVKFFESLKR